MVLRCLDSTIAVYHVYKKIRIFLRAKVHSTPRPNIIGGDVHLTFVKISSLARANLQQSKCLDVSLRASQPKTQVLASPMRRAEGTALHQILRIDADTVDGMALSSSKRLHI